MQELFHQIRELLNPAHLINQMLDLMGPYVYFGLFFVVFAETGLAVGFFLPGDSMLVVSGLMIVGYVLWRRLRGSRSPGTAR